MRWSRGSQYHPCNTAEFSPCSKAYRDFLDLTPFSLYQLLFCCRDETSGQLIEGRVNWAYKGLQNGGERQQPRAHISNSKQESESIWLLKTEIPPTVIYFLHQSHTVWAPPNNHPQGVKNSNAHDRQRISHSNHCIFIWPTDVVTWFTCKCHVPSQFTDEKENDRNVSR